MNARQDALEQVCRRNRIETKIFFLFFFKKKCASTVARSDGEAIMDVRRGLNQVRLYCDAKPGPKPGRQKQRLRLMHMHALVYHDRVQ